MPTSAASRVLQKRALQCSFSSVFHLKKAGMNSVEAKNVEQLFMGAVGGPLLAMGAVGVWWMEFNE
jgi:hypothetical protein